MIICKSRNFIFPKGHSNAGSTVKAALSRLCDDNDCISDYNPAEIPVLKAAGYRLSQNNRDSKDNVLIPYASLWSLACVYDAFPDLAAFDVIGICRNPYDKAYSFAKWVLMHKRYSAGMASLPVTPDMVRKSLNTHLRTRFREPDTLSTYRHLHDGRRAGSLFLIRFENLEADLEKVFHRYGETMPPLFHFKDSSKVCSLPWQEVLTRKEMDLVNRVMEKDFEVFGYEMQ